MSHLALLEPAGRGAPRSSPGGQFAPLDGIALIAALPGWSAMVGAGPPLSWSGPRLGSPLANVPGQLESPELRLKPPSRIAPEQFPPPLMDSSELRSVIAEPWAKMPPVEPAPPAEPAVPVGEPVPPPPPAAPDPALLPATVAWSRLALDGEAAPTPPPLPPAPPLPPLPPALVPGPPL